MKETLGQASAEAVKQLMAWLKAGGEYVGAQAPDIARQYLAWRWWEAVMGIGLGVILILVCVVFWIIAIKQPLNNGDTGTGFGVAGFISLCAGIGITAANAYTLVQVTVAPKIVLIEGLQRMVR